MKKMLCIIMLLGLSACSSAQITRTQSAEETPQWVYDLPEEEGQHYFLSRIEKGEGLPLRGLSLDDDASALIKPFCFITFKPVMYIANVDEAGLQGNEHTAKVSELAKSENATMVVVCAAIESELTELDDDDKKDFLQDLGLDEPGLDRVIHAGYALLGLETYFTAGVKEVRAWTIPASSTAPQAAGKIHTDFERGFIRAEVMAFDDFVQYKGEQGAKEAGKLRSEGKEYIVKDGDVVHFRFNV